MASLIQELQDLLIAERGLVEAVRLFEGETESMDPDIADGLGDVEQSATWICQGLYHRITQLDATPTLQTGDLKTRIMEKPELEDRLKILCAEQQALSRQTGQILKLADVDKATRELLDETKSLHNQSKAWCESVLAQWKKESYLPPV